MTYTCLSFTETFENIIETIFNEVYVPIIRLVFDILLKYQKMWYCFLAGFAAKRLCGTVKKVVNF